MLQLRMRGHRRLTVASYAEASAAYLARKPRHPGAVHGASTGRKFATIRLDGRVVDARTGRLEYTPGQETPA